MSNFKLFMGELGNGVTVCNSAVMEHGDYKQIAHISPAGNIKYYVPVLSIPGDALLRIEHTAGAMYENFKRDLERETVARPGEVYERMLDALTASELAEHIGKKIKGLEASIDDLRPLYLARA